MISGEYQVPPRRQEGGQGKVRWFMKILCHSCGKELPRGSLKYVIEIKSFADFDGYLEEYPGDVEEGINDLLDAIEHADPGSIRAAGTSSPKTPSGPARWFSKSWRPRTPFIEAPVKTRQYAPP
jgi:hypothetical protein